MKKRSRTTKLDILISGVNEYASSRVDFSAQRRWNRQNETSFNNFPSKQSKGGFRADDARLTERRRR